MVAVLYHRTGGRKQAFANRRKQMNARSYLDWNATAPVRPEARAAVESALGCLGNPSSIHAEGRAARRLIEAARESVAALVGGSPGAVTFTSGGTEANVLALSPVFQMGGKERVLGRLLVSTIEHPSVLTGGRFSPERVDCLPVGPDGMVDLDFLRDRLVELAGESVLVSIMLANNETGVLQPIRAIAELAHSAGALLHVDAVQGPGKIDCDIGALGADLLTLSAHKMGGLAGAGALVRGSDALRVAEPLLRGGGQERRQRAGTENLVGIVAFGAAAAAARRQLGEERRRMLALRDRLEAGLRAVTPDVVIFGAAAERLPNTTLFARRGGKAETLVIAFDLEGVAVSSGSACSSGKVTPSHVLRAMGADPSLAQGAIRVSLGRTTTESDVDRCVSAWKKLSGGLSGKTEGVAA